MSGREGAVNQYTKLLKSDPTFEKPSFVADTAIKTGKSEGPLKRNEQEGGAIAAVETFPQQEKAKEIFHSLNAKQ